MVINFHKNNYNISGHGSNNIINNEIENNDNNKSKNYHIDDSKIVIDVKNNFILFGI